ncbi:MAG: HpcH/HpaI aldolase/citrate lyase family protein [Deltaproteobacteria bacterium]|jgi:citrate lyase beta subunit|nr:HpcH/HpaI aldolase/citrate lyase family protein [Deltaproteobacteria bacterium]
MKSIKFGATMYAPATRPDLIALGNSLKYPNLRTVVFCTEDSVSLNDLPKAIKNLQLTFPRLVKAPIQRFVRPKNLEVLKTLLTLPGVENVNGFVLPKADLDTLPSYFKLLARHEAFELMPTLETKAVFDLVSMRRLRDYLAKSPLASRIAVLRIGSLDLMSVLSLRRDINRVIYDTPIGHAIDQLITIFKTAGFSLSAPGFEGLDQAQILMDELSLDVSRGLFAKTCVHPDQVDIIHDAYKVTPEELEMAEAILSPERPAVFRMAERMCEKAVHANWAAVTMERARLFGAWPKSALPFFQTSDEIARKTLS